MESEIRSLRQELENRSNMNQQQQQQTAHLLKNVNELESLQVGELKQLFAQLKVDAEKIEKVSILWIDWLIDWLIKFIDILTQFIGSLIGWLVYFFYYLIFIFNLF